MPREISLGMIHGLYGWPGEHFLGRLASYFREKGIVVSVPQMPNAWGMTPATWNEVTELSIGPDERTILVGHSTGATNILHFLGSPGRKVGGIMLVSGFCRELENSNFQKATTDFVIPDSFDWDLVRQNANGNIAVVHSQDDDVVRVEDGLLIARNLKVKPRIFQNCGHFNQAKHWKLLVQVLEGVIDRAN